MWINEGSNFYIIIVCLAFVADLDDEPLIQLHMLVIQTFIFTGHHILLNIERLHWESQLDFAPSWRGHDRIGEQVHQHLLNSLFITAHHERASHAEFYVKIFAWAVTTQNLYNFFGQLLHWKYGLDIGPESSVLYAIYVKEALDLDLGKLWGVLNEIIILTSLLPFHSLVL